MDTKGSKWDIHRSCHVSARDHEAPALPRSLGSGSCMFCSKQLASRKVLHSSFGTLGENRRHLPLQLKEKWGKWCCAWLQCRGYRPSCRHEIFGDACAWGSECAVRTFTRKCHTKFNQNPHNFGTFDWGKCDARLGEHDVTRFNCFSATSSNNSKVKSLLTERGRESHRFGRCEYKSLLLPFLCFVQFVLGRCISFSCANQPTFPVSHAPFSPSATVVKFDLVPFRSDVDEVLKELKVTTEQLVIPIIAYVGIAANVLVCCLLRCNKQMRQSSKILLHFLLVSQMCYLASVAVYLKLKELDYEHDHVVMNFAGIAVSASQIVAVWMLFLLVTENCKILQHFKSGEKPPVLWKTMCKITFTLLFVLAFHLPFVPHIRVALYQFNNLISPCSLPLDDHWDFTLPKQDEPLDQFYLLYFSVGYIVLTYALPYLLIGRYPNLLTLPMNATKKSLNLFMTTGGDFCILYWMLNTVSVCRDKDVIDLLHWVQSDRTLSEQACASAFTAFLCTVLCNVYLCCSTPKFVFMIFYLFNHPMRYLRDSYKFFYVANSFGNLVLVLWPMTNIVVLIVCDEEVRNRVKSCCIARCRRITGPVRRKCSVQQRPKRVPCVCKNEEEIEITFLAENEGNFSSTDVTDPRL